MLPCVRGNGFGTVIDEEAQHFAEWRATRREAYAAANQDFTDKYRSDERLQQEIDVVLGGAHPPQIYESCDDAAAQLIHTFAKQDRESGIKAAKANPDRFLSTWTFAVLFRIAQIAQTVPTEDRARGSLGRYAKLLKPDKNDFSDATIAALGARCGFLITQDSNLRERITFLYRRGACRIQAFSFEYIEATWSVPGV